MEEKNKMDVFDDILLPGFRFNPTDEELIDFYLKKKIQQKALQIDMIKQVEIYKYDPWDLPKMACGTGEKEMYFYCQRDRKYRNSARPNRVTRAGFWKATGTDRPIYSSKGNYIGLKKSLVFYRGRAAKGIKTEWMMHEFRLPPPLPDPSLPSKNLSQKALSPTEAWAICRIFKKTSSHKPSSHSQPWIPQFQESLPVGEGGGATASSSAYFSTSDVPTLEASGSMLLNPGWEGFEGANQQFSGFSTNIPQDMQENVNRARGFSFTAPASADVWKSPLLWDSPLFN